MHFEDAHLDETDQSRQVLDIRIGANSALFLDLDPFDAVGSLGPHVLLVEACGSLSGRTRTRLSGRSTTCGRIQSPISS